MTLTNAWKALMTYIVLDDVYHAENIGHHVYAMLDDLKHLPPECWADTTETLINVKCNMENSLYREHQSPVVSCSNRNGALAFARDVHVFDHTSWLQLTLVKAGRSIHVPTALYLLKDAGLGDTILHIPTYTRLAKPRTFKYYAKQVARRVEKENEYISLNALLGRHCIIQGEDRLEAALDKLLLENHTK